MSCKISRADKRHLADINRLIVEAKISDPLDELPSTFWFVRKDGRIVGCVGGEFISDDAFVAQHLAVDKSYRKQGIGMTLFNHMVEHAIENGATTVSFITMYYHFRRFKKHGFRTIPRKQLPEHLQNHWMYTAKRYMKCAAMI